MLGLHSRHAMSVPIGDSGRTAATCCRDCDLQKSRHISPLSHANHKIFYIHRCFLEDAPSRLILHMMARLQGALDTDVHLSVQRFLSQGVPAKVPDLYTALQKSNSSLKRRQKKVLLASIERVLEFLGLEENDDYDSEAPIDDIVPDSDEAAQIMNKSLRANLAAPRSPPAMSAMPEIGGENGTSSKRKANGESLPKRQKRVEVSEAPYPVFHMRS